MSRNLSTSFIRLAILLTSCGLTADRSIAEAAGVSIGVSAGPSVGYFSGGGSKFDRTKLKWGVAGRWQLDRRLSIRSGVYAHPQGSGFLSWPEARNAACRTLYLSLPVELEYTGRPDAATSAILGVGLAADRLLSATYVDDARSYDAEDEFASWDAAVVASLGVRPRSGRWDVRARHAWGLRDVLRESSWWKNRNLALLVTWWVSI